MQLSPVCLPHCRPRFCGLVSITLGHNMGVSDHGYFVRVEFGIPGEYLWSGGAVIQCQDSQC